MVMIYGFIIIQLVIMTQINSNNYNTVKVMVNVNKIVIVMLITVKLIKITII